MNQNLVNAELKQTKARLAILDILKSGSKPMDVSEIISELSKMKINSDQATVYRTLNAFYQKGLIKRFELQEGKFRYELGREEHHHLICENCGQIQDISDCNLEAWEDEISKKKKFLVKRHALEFFGLCADCVNKS